MVKQTSRDIGFKELNQALDALDAKTKGKVLYTVNRRFVRHLKNLLNDRAPIETTRSTYGVSGQPYKPLDEGAVIVKSKANLSGVLVGISADAFHARFIEYGTTVRKTRKGGLNRGEMTAKPYVEKTLDRETPAIMQRVVREYQTITKKVLEQNLRAVAKRITKLKS